MTATAVSWPQTMELSPLREQLEQLQQQQAGAFSSSTIEQLLQQRSALIDSLISYLWRQLKLPEQHLCVLAVGGYGRGTLHPGSDIDLLILHEKPLDQHTNQALIQFVQWLWDVRLDVGHSLRTIAESLAQAAEDISTATSLLEHRWLIGDKELAARFTMEVHHHLPWSSRNFYQAKLQEQQQRHQHYHGTAYNLEPNIKSSPGGLRDIQTISWIAKRHFQTQSDEALVDYGYVTAAELIELRNHQDFLWSVRFALHLEAGKKEDRLLFDYQPGVAARMGYGEAGKQAVEAMMKDYFNAVVAVSELNAMLLQFFEQAILLQPTAQSPLPSERHQSLELNADFKRIGHTIVARHDQVFSHPRQLLGFFLLIAEQGDISAVQAQTIRLLRNARRDLRRPLSDDASCRELFMAIMRHPNGCGDALSLMHKHKILAHYLPQWQQIVGQMQFDLFHAYTVDEHTYRVVRNLYRYSDPSYASEFPICADLVASFDKPELLYLAGIFHDIAKGRGGDHSELGAIDALHFAIAHDLEQPDAELISWLVKYHLVMSVTAQKRDIHDPEVVREFAQLMDSQQHLDYLYCLTVADIRATNSTLWNNWKATLLENLYLATSNFLQQSKPSAAVELRARINQNQHQALALLLSAGEAHEQIQQLWSRFTADYFLRHQAEQICWHTRAIAALRDDHELPLILIGDENNRGTTELFIYTQEQANLFAAVAAVLDSQGISIHDAQILATRDGYVMDTFVILNEHGQALSDTGACERLHQQLHDVLRKRQQVPHSQRRIPRQLRSFSVPTRVEFVAEKNQRRSAFELTTLDRPGLVARVARVLQDLDINILAAKITTVGEQAEDLFVVSTRQQQALNSDQREHLQQAIIAALD
jgi:[protein-PII] uridylyltransferase